MTDEERRVANLIHEAFRGVTLGDGIGLLEAQALDDYAGPERQAECRVDDEKVDWSAIPADKLNSCYSSLCFFDAEGMRFHLPAFLIADLEGTFLHGVIFHLCYTENDNLSLFNLLSGDQRAAVQAFLQLYLQRDPDEIDNSCVQQALETYWAPSADT